MSGFAAITGRARRPADAAAVRARRRHRRAGDELRRHRRPAQRRGDRPRSGRRRGDHRADHDDARPPDHDVRPARPVQQRLGNRSVNNAPRNVYRTADGEWVAVSTSSQSIAERVMRLVGRPELIDEPWFATGHQRAEHADELDDAVGTWIAARPTAEVLAAFEAAEAAIGPVYDVARRDERPAVRGARHGADRSTTTSSVPSRCRTCCSACPATPGSIRWAGRPHGADTAEVLAEIGVDARPSSPTFASEASCERALTDADRHRAVRARATGRSASPRRWRRAPSS